MKLGEIIKNYRREHSMSLRDFAQSCGMSHSYISMLEDGKNSKTGEPMVPTLASLKKIATALGMTLNELMSIADDMPVMLKQPSDVFISYKDEDSDTRKLFDSLGIRPVTRKRFRMLGDIACGQPIFANEEHETYVDASATIDADFCLTARGDSMINAGIKNGDVVFIKQRPIVDNGDIAAIIIDGEATLKYWFYYPEKKKLVLNPANQSYEPLVYVGAELDEITCLGKAVCYMSKL